MTAPDAAVLDAQGLEKWYGPVPAVRDVTFRLARGEFLALFGPNGAGKSTLLRMLAGAVRPTRGTVSFGGEPLRSGELGWRRQVGVLSHTTFLYGGLTAEENLRFFGRLYDLDRGRERVAEALRGVGLWERRGERVRTFSRGMQQRLALARTLLHDPQVVLLDEPYTGLDPHAAATLRETLERLREERRTVLLVTHNFAEGLELADRVVVQVAGRWIWDQPRSRVQGTDWQQEYGHLVESAA